MNNPKEVLYSSTRNNSLKVQASKAILKGLSEDGGLFVPDRIPELDKSLKELAAMEYKEIAYEVMKLFLTDFTEEELKDCIASAYDSKFDTDEIAPLVWADGAYYLELFHGATIAFKDMALSSSHFMIRLDKFYLLTSPKQAIIHKNKRHGSLYLSLIPNSGSRIAFHEDKQRS